jgi:hypothetical protein
MPRPAPATWAFVYLALGCAGYRATPGPAAATCPAEATCFDFEGDTPGQPPGAPWTAKGPVAIDEAHAHGGRRAVRVSPQGKDASAFFSLTAGFPRAGNQYWGRAMVYADSLPAGTRHFTLAQSTGTVAGKPEYGKTYYTVGAEGSQLITNYDTEGVKSDCWKFGGALATRKWVCLEWHFDGPGDEIALFVDGVEDRAAHVVSGKGDGCLANGTAQRWAAPTFAAMELGYEVYGKDVPHQLWFDDVALGANRVGCPRP